MFLDDQLRREASPAASSSWAVPLPPRTRQKRTATHRQATPTNAMPSGSGVGISPGTPDCQTAMSEGTRYQLPTNANTIASSRLMILEGGRWGRWSHPPNLRWTTEPFPASTRTAYPRLAPLQTPATVDLATTNPRPGLIKPDNPTQRPPRPSSGPKLRMLAGSSRASASTPNSHAATPASCDSGARIAKLAIWLTAC